MKTLNEIKKEALEIMGKWNGDDAGVEEDNSNTAEDILEAVKNLEELLAEIHNEDTSKYDKYELPGFKEVKDSLDNLTIRK